MKNSQIFDLIERIVALIRSEERKKCTEIGLQPVHMQMLDYLHRCNRYCDTPAALSSYLGMTRGTVSQTVLLMARKGLISKEADANDKRVVHLLLTNEGEAILNQAKMTSVFKQATEALVQGEVGSHEQALIEVLTALQKANQSQSFGLCKTCKYFTTIDKGFVCGLTKEKLSKSDSEKVCQEHMLE